MKMDGAWLLKNKKLVVLLLFLALFIILTGFVALYFEEPYISDVVNYHEDGLLDYQICLTENEFISENCINGNRSFVTSMIDSMTMKLNYNISSSNVLQYRYTYNVTANVRAVPKEEGQTLVYDETYVLLEKSEKTSSGNLSIDEEIPVDFNAYNQMITEFKKNYVLALDSILEITATIHVEGWSNDVADSITKNYTMTLSMPLSESTTKVTLKNNQIEDTDTLLKYDESGIYSYKNIILSILTIIDVVLVSVLGISLFRSIPKEKSYQRIVKEILKNYDQALVKTLSPPDLTGYRTIEVETFEDILDARDNLQKPILFYENKSKTGCEFVIINDQVAYRFCLGNKRGITDHAS